MTPLALLLVASTTVTAPAPAAVAKPTLADVLASSKPEDWRPVDPAHTIQLELESGRVVIELAPSFAPRHVANILALARERYFDGLAIVRSQDNYVVQWGDPAGKRVIRRAQRALAPEFTRDGEGLAFTALPERDAYATEVGFAGGFPAARDPAAGRAWLAHCYGMVGAGRDEAADSGSGAELYVVIGHAPRHLDRNITLVGRVLRGIELLSTLPRGTGALGFYEKPEQHVPIRSIRVAADLPPEQRPRLEVLRTDTATFAALVEAQRNRSQSWYLVPAGHIDLCNVPLPVRERPAP